jgi:DNA-binding response OmpR family regulator
MDIQMPIMDGYTATKKIHEHSKLQQLPIIALTAGAFKNQRENAYEAGMNGFIPKPFEVNLLVSEIQRLTPNHQYHLNPALISSDAIEISRQNIPIFCGAIDYARGLEQWKSPEIYQKYLGIFSRDHHEDPIKLEEAISAGDYQKANNITHKLKGASTALALNEIADNLTKIERNLIDNTPLIENVNALKLLMKITCEEIARYQCTFVTSISDALIPANKIVSDSLIELATALESDDLTLIEEILFVSSSIIPKVQFQSIVESVESFDLRGAEKLVAALILNLDHSGK